MIIKHLTPEPFTTKLENLSRGTVFRFQNASIPYILLPNITGDEIKTMYNQRIGYKAEMLDDIEIHDENLYVWEEDGDKLDKNEYINSCESEELIAYIRLADGKLLLSHRHEIVIPLVATLTIEDVRSSD
jgi:hypothetical protein